MVPLAYSFSSSRLLMLYLLDTVHAQDCSGACLRRKLYTSKGISAKRAHTHIYIYIYIMYEADHSRVPARAAYRLPLSFSVVGIR